MPSCWDQGEPNATMVVCVYFGTSVHADVEAQEEEVEKTWSEVGKVPLPSARAVGASS